ncbi:TPA: helix-turn-helix transcriptional regulator [Kluyvera ascorbata]|nr:helix-turn-helix transcriptional regulator [Kluyvera ascorbata]
MTGYELRLWRKGLGWSRDKAAEELDISLRTYKDYENAHRLKRSIALATVTLSLQDQLPRFRQNRTSGDKMRELLSMMVDDVTHQD